MIIWLQLGFFEIVLFLTRFEMILVYSNYVTKICTNKYNSFAFFNNIRSFPQNSHFLITGLFFRIYSIFLSNYEDLLYTSSKVHLWRFRE